MSTVSCTGITVYLVQTHHHARRATRGRHTLSKPRIVYLCVQSCERCCASTTLPFSLQPHTAVATAAGTLGSTRGPLDAERQATRERAALCIMTTAARLRIALAVNVTDAWLTSAVARACRSSSVRTSFLHSGQLGTPFAYSRRISHRSMHAA